ncbi:unnamed protein product [Gadus morhua 'NCC']
MLLHQTAAGASRRAVSGACSLGNTGLPAARRSGFALFLSHTVTEYWILDTVSRPWTDRPTVSENQLYLCTA